MPTPTFIKGNAVVGQSGGPTAVINQSLVGVVEALKQFKAVKKIYGMRNGVSGLTKTPPALVDLGKLAPAKLKAIAQSPAAALGSSRDKPDAEYCARIVEACKAANIRYFFYIGGNDSSDTCRIVNELANKGGASGGGGGSGGGGYELRCFHVPKTVDNDLMENDHTPGFPSAARFVATAFMADSLDNASLPGVKINVVMGRHAGFLTAASALARRNKDDGPHLIYVPESPVTIEEFASDVQRVFDRLGRCQVAVSEGVKDRSGRPVIASLVSGLDVDAHGNIQLSGTGALGDALAEHIKKTVKTPSGRPPRVRADTFGYLQRCWPDASPVDVKEARGAGKFAVKLAQQGHASGSVAIVRISDKPYKSAFKRIELGDVAAKTRHLPAEFIKGDNDVTPALVRYLRPLVGKLPELATL